MYASIFLQYVLITLLFMEITKFTFHPWVCIFPLVKFVSFYFHRARSKHLHVTKISNIFPANLHILNIGSIQTERKRGLIISTTTVECYCNVCEITTKFGIYI